MIEGRIKDMVIRGGENVYPREIEEFLYTHPDIQDVQVIGVPDTKYGEELMACIILKPGAGPLDAAACAEYCQGQAGALQDSRYVKVRESFPMTVSGKIRKVDNARGGRGPAGALAEPRTATRGHLPPNNCPWMGRK